MEKENLTFDQLPRAVTILTNEVRELRLLLIEKQELIPTPQTEIWFDLDGLIEYDPEKRSKPTFYSKISKGELPYYKTGKKVYFLKSEIDNWLKAGRKKSNIEIEKESEAYFLKNKKGLNNGK